MEITNKSVNKQNCRVNGFGYTLSKCFAEFRGFDNSIEKCCKALSEFISLCLYFVPRYAFKSVEQPLTNRFAKVCEVALFPHIFDFLRPISPFRINGGFFEHIKRGSATTAILVVLQLIKFIKTKNCFLEFFCRPTCFLK